ncbi:MAG TPA: carbohydrate kinase family protein [Dissulfurispiraceae bacterium]|nr:carbohydrate kinase family protein [Dissulfurispiraceae bacterium]
MNIYISGSMAYDRIMDFPGFFSDHILPDKIHILNVCFTVNGLQEKYGGTAGNIAYSLRLLGEKPTILATIGRDHANYFQWLESNNIETNGIRIINDEFTAGAYITTDKADNQITGFNPGAMKYRSEYAFPAGNEKAIGLIAPGNLGDMMEYAKYYKSNGISCICDPGQSLTAWTGKDLTEWIAGSSILISNDYELELISKMTGKGKQELLGITKTIITTLGENGSLISTSAGDTAIPIAKPMEVADPTGAGDAYRAGLLKGLVEGKSIASAAKIGAVSATYAIEKYGTQEHRFTLAGFRERYRAAFGEDM